MANLLLQTLSLNVCSALATFLLKSQGRFFDYFEIFVQVTLVAPWSKGICDEGGQGDEGWQKIPADHLDAVSSATLSSSTDK